MTREEYLQVISDRKKNKTMNQHPFNNSEYDDSNGLVDINKHQQPINQEVELTTTQSKEVKAAKQSLKRFTLILIVVGVSLGVILAVGTISFLNRFNLFDVPTQVDQPSK
ncbi:hypothetical protein IQ264_09255 [Phormidium sp. LEGE 05292]|uniref:hypothetical protein n=1 Tax=[Phormidium] sp. LEGE 05292 TaxID=767427 RepID=UPI00187E15ED|nr:hypothetical protein [Phormidium sp. LEGE 05292]MBE9225607.1 hypothetical protein [Phormidium sp. LEGE 05292]